MANSPFLPSREANLVTWSANMATRLTADPARYGIDIAMAATFQGLNDTFAAAYTAANADLTRTPTAIVAKNGAMDALIDGPGGIRELVDFIQGNPATTDVMRSELQITIRDVVPTPIPAPTHSPHLDILSRLGHTVTIRLHDPLAPGFGKPKGVQGATVFSFVGASPPADLADWKFEGQKTRPNKVAIDFPLTLAPSTQVWLAAFWYNPRGQAGPSNVPVTTNLDSVASAA